MDEQGLDDIKSLKTNLKKNRLTEEELETLRRDVKKIMQKREKEEEARRRAEMEHFYELGLYANGLY